MSEPDSATSARQRPPAIVEEVGSSSSSDHTPIHQRKRSSKSPSNPPLDRDHDQNRSSLHNSRRRPFSRDSQKLSTLLLLTSERLDLETNRANNAERRAADCFSRLRAALDAKSLADRNTARVVEELRLYKIQLDAAQQEIFRAQDVIDKVEKARHEAELDAAKARSKAREYHQEWSILNAREEGKRDGYNEGLRRGRRLGFEEGRAAGYADGEDYFGRYDYREPTREREHVVRFEDQVIPPPSRAEPTQSRPNHPPHIPDVAPFAKPPPIPTLTSPFSADSNQYPVTSFDNRPETSHPVTSRRRPPSPSSRSVDSFIPSADQNSFISMPAPHELAGVSPRTSFKPLEATHDTNEPVLTTRRRRRSASIASKASTHLSEFDLVSPPRHQPSQHFSEETGDGGDDTFTRDRNEYASPQGEVNGSHPRSSGQASQGYRDPESEAEEWQPSNSNIPETTRNDVHQPPGRGRSMSNPLAGDVGQSEPSVVKSERARSPILGKLFKKMKPLLHRDSSTHSVPGITIDPPSSSPSTISDAAQSSNFLSPDTATHAIPIVDDPGQDIHSKLNHIPGPSLLVQHPIQHFSQSDHAPVRSPSKPAQYAIAPIPSGVSYPDPPGSQHTPTGLFVASPRLGRDGTSGSTLKGLKSGPSPARLDRPISLFSE